MKIIAKHCPTNRDKEKTYSENEFVVQVALLDRESNVIHLPLYVALETEDIADEFTETFNKNSNINEGLLGNVHNVSGMIGLSYKQMHLDVRR